MDGVYTAIVYAQRALSVNVYERRSQPSQIYWLSYLTRHRRHRQWSEEHSGDQPWNCVVLILKISTDSNLLILIFALVHTVPRDERAFEFDFFLVLFTAHQRTQESWVKSNRKKSQSSGKKKKITKLRAKCQKKKTDEPLRVVLRVCKSEDLKNSITSAKKSIFLFSTTLKREPTEPSNLRHHRECVVSTESVCARVGRSLIQFHCLSRASEINQKKMLVRFRLRSRIAPHSLRLRLPHSIASRIASHSWTHEKQGQSQRRRVK